MPSKHTGRRTRLTPQLQQAIAQAVSGGVPFTTACRLAGISEFLGHEWRERGEGKHPTRPSTPLYADFAKAIAHAKAQDETRRVLRINQAGQGGAIVYQKTTTYPDGRTVHEERRSEPSWQADAFHLERSQPDVWGRRERLDIRVSIQQAAAKVAADLGMTAEEVLAEAQALLYELDHGATLA